MNDDDDDVLKVLVTVDQFEPKFNNHVTVICLNMKFQRVRLHISANTYRQHTSTQTPGLKTCLFVINST